jgi:hypothetical protein
MILRAIFYVKINDKLFRPMKLSQNYPYRCLFRYKKKRNVDFSYAETDNINESLDN